MLKIEFRTAEKLNLDRLLSESGLPFSLEKESTANGRVRYFDTFDWRLFAKQLALAKNGRKWELHNLSQNEVIAAETLTGSPKFSEDFPDGDLRRKIAPLLEMRALQLRGDVHIETSSFRVLNSMEKTIARLSINKLLTNAESKPVYHLTMVGLRGYDEAFNHLSNAVADHPSIETSNSAFEAIMAAAGQQPGEYSGKLQLNLRQEMTALDAAREIFGQLLDIIRQNEQGTVGDIDSEFLHDFRVAIRRTRSGLSQIRGIFPPDDVDKFKNAFADLQRQTNDLRDLDVYLMDAPTYRQLLPEQLRPAIEPVFAHLQSERKKALRKVRRALNSSEYVELLNDWQRYLKYAQPEVAPNAVMPAVELAKQRIYKRYRRVIKDGKAIGTDSPDEQLHTLRIDCKKLRYLLEFFESLFPAGEVKQLIKQLKKLQDNLGKFNDLSVQIDTLYNWLNLFSKKGSGVQTVAAIGSLIGTLSERKRQMRATFHDTFAQFSSQEIRSQFKSLFAG